MDWKEGTYFSVAIWGYRSWWRIEKNVDEKTCNCLFIKGTDPRLFTNGGMFNGFLKSYYKYGGREEKPPLKYRLNNFLLSLLRVVKSF